MKDLKTNVMRVLEKENIPYTAHSFFNGKDTPTDGVTVAAMIGKDAASVYKTLVTRGADKNYFVFVIPVAEHLDLKKAARSVGEKSVEMIKQSELLPLTGYVHGGCSPIGMKKQFKTTFHSAVTALETVTLSAGKVGYQIEVAPEDIIRIVGGQTADIVF